ncbi:MAG: hypothetical protein ACRYG4_20360 [Janthinobacterium lividum]
MSEAIDRLLDAMRDELEALDSGDVGRIETATRAKVAALDRMHGTGTVAVARLHQARALNALASTRVNMLMAGIDRRLAVLVAADGRAASLCYGRDGQRR